MLNKKRKGFTIVELVIVIAVIAVLAAVLIPTFSSVVDRAHESAALQEVQSAYIEALAEALGSDLKDKEVKVGDFTFKFADATGQNAEITNTGEFGTKYPNAKVENGVVVLGGTSDETDETDGTGDGTVSNPYTVSTEDQLKDALSKGGYIKLTNNIDLTNTGGNVSISEDVNIDLAGCTLEIIDVNEIAMDENGDFVNNLGSDIVSVSGKLTITDTGNTGSLVIAEPNGVVDNFSLDDYYVGYMHYFCGIRVAESGTLTLENINVSGNRHYNIVNAGSVEFNNVVYDVNGGASSTYHTWEVYGLYNEGPAEITDATFTVNSGTGFANYYAGTVEDVKISGNTSSFLLNGANVIAIENDGGKMSVNGTSVQKESNFSCDNYYTSAIAVADSSDTGTSEISLINVTFAEGIDKTVNVDIGSKAKITGGTYYGVSCTNGGTLIIETGTFKGAVSAGNYASITIIDGDFTDTGAVFCNNAGTINIDGGTFAGGVSSAHNEATIKITNGTFNSALTLSECSHIYISDGTFNKAITLNNTGTKNISGGTFASDISAYVATGYTATKNETTGYWTVTAS